MIRISLFLMLTVVALSIHAQDETVGDIFKVDYDTPLTIELEEEEEEIVEAKKKKVKPNVFLVSKRRRTIHVLGSEMM